MSASGHLSTLSDESHDSLTSKPVIWLHWDVSGEPMLYSTAFRMWYAPPCTVFLAARYLNLKWFAACRSSHDLSGLHQPQPSSSAYQCLPWINFGSGLELKLWWRWWLCPVKEISVFLARRPPWLTHTQSQCSDTFTFDVIELKNLYCS